MIAELVLALYAFGGFLTGSVVSLLLFFHLRS